MYLWVNEPDRQRAVFAGVSSEPDGLVDYLFAESGVQVVGRFDDLSECLTLRALPECDVLILFVRPDTVAGGAGRKRLLLTVTEFRGRFECPLLVIFHRDEPGFAAALIEAGATSILSVGPGSERFRTAVRSAIAIEDKQRTASAAAAKARRDLEERKLVERAKSILMQQRNMAEPDAFRHLQQSSMQSNEPLARVAEKIIAAKELLG